MNGNKLWQFGSICLLLLSSIFNAQAQTECRSPLLAEKLGYSASLELSANCSRGMFTLTIRTPDGLQQSLYEAYQQPISAIWLERLSGQSQPDLVLLQQPNEQLLGLTVYSWTNNHYQKLSLSQPEPSSLADYEQQDQVYVRWGKLVRQVKVTSNEGSGWRRLTYDFKNNRWIEEN